MFMMFTLFIFEFIFISVDLNIFPCMIYFLAKFLFYFLYWFFS